MPGGGLRKKTIDVRIPNAPKIIRRTENTIVEIRAQFLRPSKPTAVTIHHTAGSAYKSGSTTLNTLKNIGGSCALFVSGIGATNIVTAISTAIIRRRAEPMSAKIAITVIPAERFFFPVTSSSFDFEIGNDCTLRSLALTF